MIWLIEVIWKSSINIYKTSSHLLNSQENLPRYLRLISSETSYRVQSYRSTENYWTYSTKSYRVLRSRWKSILLKRAWMNREYLSNEPAGLGSENASHLQWPSSAVVSSVEGKKLLFIQTCTRSSITKRNVQSPP